MTSASASVIAARATMTQQSRSTPKPAMNPRHDRPAKKM